MSVLKSIKGRNLRSHVQWNPVNEIDREHIEQPHREKTDESPTLEETFRGEKEDTDK